MAAPLGRGKRIEFLWRASHQYSNLCPQLAAFLGDKLLDLTGPAPVTERVCPGCGALLLPAPSSTARVRTISRKRLRELRKKKKVNWLTLPLRKASLYLLVSCGCGGQYLTGAPRVTPASATTSVNTPSSAARRRKKRLSSTLKSKLETNSQQQTPRKKETSSLSLFLTALST